MDAYHSYLNDLVNLNKTRFSAYPQLNWINPYSAPEFQRMRDQLMARLKDNILFKDTKPFYKKISPGCNLCGKGLWSCLFITGRCNASCFYCPAPQERDDVPTSQGLTFPTAASYAGYVAHFNFKGVSFSGGEPLLVPGRVLSYLGEVRRVCSDDVYTWMYTNGILASKSIFSKLASIGLNEVRFDIGATNYSLNKIKYAKDIIEHISIEIPAIPEEKEKLKILLPEMIKAGVSNLNFHQLRLTEHNAPRLSNKPYTYIPAEKPIVLESELAALEIIDYAKTHELDIGINYCSFFFKNRFQQAGFRSQIARKFATNENDISERGYIRGHNNDEIQYKNICIADEGSLRDNACLLELKHKNYSYKTDIIYRRKIENAKKHQKIKAIISSQAESPPVDSEMFSIWQCEHIEKGLRQY